MSKQSEAKAKQGYALKAATCSTCGHLRSKIVEHGVWTEEKNIHCGIGGFAVKKMGSCKEWVGKVEKPKP